MYVSDGIISAEGEVVQQVAPRSYQVNTPHGPLRKNRKHFHLLPTHYNYTKWKSFKETLTLQTLKGGDVVYRIT